MKSLNIKELVGRKKFQILIIMIGCILFGIIYSFYFVQPKYQASTTLILGIINLINEENLNELQTTKVTPTDIVLNSNLVSTYSELIKSNTLISKVKENLNLEISEKTLKKSIEIKRISESELLEITAKNSDSKLASDIANEMAVVFSEKIKEIYNVSKVYIIDSAVPTVEPYNINHIRDIIIFIFCGILFSIIYLLISYKTDKKIKTTIDIEKEVGIKTLISIPIKKEDKKNKSELVNLNDNKLLLAQAFKNLRTNVQFTNVNNKENKVILVTSCFSSEGKSFVSANLAVAFAEAGKKVILIDANMRRGRQAKIFNIPNNLGLSNYLSNLDTNGMEINERVNSFINETEIKNLNVITSGTVPPNPTELLESEKLLELVKDLSVFYDVVIFDGPAVLPISDSLVITRIANSTILVSLCNKTKKDELEKAKNDIQNVGGRIVGVVLNKVTLNNHKNENQKYYSYIFSKKNKDTEKNISIKDFFINIKNKIKERIESRKKKEIKLLLNQQKEIIEKRRLENNVPEKKDTELINDEKTKMQENKKNDKSNIEEKKETKEDFEKNEELNKKEISNKNDFEENKKIEKSKKESFVQIKEKIKEKFFELYNKLKIKTEELKKQIEKDKQIKIEKAEIERQKREEELKKNEEIKQKRQIEKEEEERIRKEIEEKEKIEAEKNKNELRKIKEAEMIAKREQELIIAEQKEKERIEQEKIKQEEKRKKEELKNELKNKKMQEKEEKRKYKMQKKEKQKAEARIQEELLEDNLYPKTKYNKNL